VKSPSRYPAQNIAGLFAVSGNLPPQGVYSVKPLFGTDPPVKLHLGPFPIQVSVETQQMDFHDPFRSFFHYGRTLS
jgi:hypothetical protein